MDEYDKLSMDELEIALNKLISNASYLRSQCKQGDTNKAILEKLEITESKIHNIITHMRIKVVRLK